MADITLDDAAQARKRRIAARNLNRPTDEASPSESKRPRVEESDDDDSSDLDLVMSTDANGNPKPHITGIKKQSRYDPGVPMTREELKNWRKEARRVRNRESAAASRKKNKERITELEMEVETIKTKYAAALELLLQGEDGQRSLAFCPAVLRQDLMEAALHQEDRNARSASPLVIADACAVASVSPPLSPMIPKNTHEELLLPPPPAPFDSEEAAAAAALAYEKESIAVHLPNHQQQHHHQHITPISRPIACV